ncbi:MAG: multidrug resistance protein [Candidatus Omnitrophota bacterium]|nr:multidrug resistance protein [Candidatus Omnitrophota bacterium]
MGVFIFCSVAGQVLLRTGARGLAEAGPGPGGNFSWWVSALTNGWILAGLAAWAVSTAAWILVLKDTPLSLAYGLTSLNYVLIPTAAWILLREPLSGLRVLGIIVICAGVAITLYARYLEMGQT